MTQTFMKEYMFASSEEYSPDDIEISDFKTLVNGKIRVKFDTGLLRVDGEATKNGNSYYRDLVEPATLTEDFKMRMNKGAMGAENGHPLFVAGVQRDLKRWQKVDQANLVCTFNNFYIEDGVLRAHAENVSGPLGDLFAQRLVLDKHIPSFSLRAVQGKRMSLNTNELEAVMKIIAFDWVGDNASRGAIGSMKSLKTDMGKNVAKNEYLMDLALAEGTDLYADMYNVQEIEDSSMFLAESVGFKPDKLIYNESTGLMGFVADGSAYYEKLNTATRTKVDAVFNAFYK